jgi:hypothetical protein
VRRAQTKSDPREPPLRSAEVGKGPHTWSCTGIWSAFQRLSLLAGDLN